MVTVSVLAVSGCGHQQSFDISQSPITVAQYRAFVLETGYMTRAETDSEHGCWGVRENLTIGWLPSESWKHNRLNQADNHPVVCVNWQDAMQYISWLSARTGEQYRLPAEREWEYAARGGSQEKYYYGSSVSKVCEHINHADLQMIKAWGADTEVSTCDDGYLTTSPVGRYPQNGFGLLDSYGNVWEWVSDCYTATLQEASALATSVSEEDCRQRTLRGGSWASQTKGTTTSYRNNGNPEVPTVDYGFRVAREKISASTASRGGALSRATVPSTANHAASGSFR